MLATRLADLGNCKDKVHQYKRHMKFKYKKEGELTTDKERTIDDWSADIQERCRENEKDLLEFVTDALETCEEALGKYLFSTNIEMEEDKVASRDMRDFLETDGNYPKFKKKISQLEQYYPEISKAIITELNRWSASGSTAPEEVRLPSMSKP